MTADYVRETAIAALREIKATPKGHVRASRQGICAAVRMGNATIIFRREDGIRMEIWPEYEAAKAKKPIYRLPPDLEREVGDVLDAL